MLISSVPISAGSYVLQIVHIENARKGSHPSSKIKVYSLSVYECDF